MYDGVICLSVVEGWTYRKWLYYKYETEEILKIGVKTMKGYLDSRHKRIVRRLFVNTWN